MTGTQERGAERSSCLRAAGAAACALNACLGEESSGGSPP